MDYYAPNSWYEEDSKDCECFKCDEKNKHLDIIQDNFVAMVNHLYGNQPIDECFIMGCIDEISDVIGVKPPKDMLMISRPYQNDRGVL